MQKHCILVDKSLGFEAVFFHNGYTTSRQEDDVFVDENDLRVLNYSLTLSSLNCYH